MRGCGTNGGLAAGPAHIDAFGRADTGIRDAQHDISCILHPGVNHDGPMAPVVDGTFESVGEHLVENHAARDDGIGGG